MKKAPLVTVQWQDIIGTSGWEKPDEVNPPTLQTTGFLIKKNKDVVKVANTKDEKGEWSSITAFPAGCVKSIKYISS
jgi:hypothetical protein|tara:strand:- start:32 stop:262 length:231 start_codon:yes stop_codon:yes gene_type:complete